MDTTTKNTTIPLLMTHEIIELAKTLSELERPLVNKLPTSINTDYVFSGDAIVRIIEAFCAARSVGPIQLPEIP